MKRIDALKLMIGDDDTSEITIKICGTYYPVETWVRIYDYLNADLLEPKEDLQEPKGEQQKPKAVALIPKKVVAGSGSRKPIDTGKLIALAKAGWTKEKIAEELQISVATVYNYLKKAREEGKL